MMKAQVGLGVLSIPAAFDTLGMIPGVITLTLIGIITSWSGYMVGEFKLKHRDVYGIEDVGQKLFGAVGREVLGFAFSLCKLFIPWDQGLAGTNSLFSLDCQIGRAHV